MYERLVKIRIEERMQEGLESQRVSRELRRPSFFAIRLNKVVTFAVQFLAKMLSNIRERMDQLQIGLAKLLSSFESDKL